jgi:hypothetical protein
MSAIVADNPTAPILPPRLRPGADGVETATVAGGCRKRRGGMVIKSDGVSRAVTVPCSLAYACVRIRRLVRWDGRL